MDISMNNYVHRALMQFNHIPPPRPQHSPHIWNKQVYGRKNTQQHTASSTAAPLDKYDTRLIQPISVIFLYYSEIDPCINPALNEISSEQSAPTKDTNNKSAMFVDYLHSHTNGTLRYHASNMILISKSDSA